MFEGGGRGRDVPIAFQPSIGSFSPRALTKSFRPLNIPSIVSLGSKVDLYGYNSK